jgi:hypothetical protein
MKPILRWTITNVHKLGFLVLKKSVESFSKLYKNSFEKVICFNNLSQENYKFLETLPVDRLVNQEDHKNDLPIEAPKFYNPAWKIYPPRLNLDVQEIILDNDIILYKKIPELEKNILIVTEAIQRSYSGPLKSFVKNKINSGLISMPPGFDLKSKIITTFQKFPYQWKDYFDEQTLIAYIAEQEEHEILSLDKIYVCCGDYKIGQYGMHFVGINGGNSTCWNMFNRIKFL